MQYDVFISYRSSARPWVEALANNLTKHGYKVFLDTWEIVAGQHFIPVLDNALNQARYGVVVITPDACDSPWINDEYEKMKIRNIAIIPVLLGGGSDFPFINNIQHIDFTKQSEYRKSFYRLMCALKGVAPGPAKDFAGDLEIPPAPQLLENTIPLSIDSLKDREKLDEMFEPLNQAMILILLAQADFGFQPVVDTLVNMANPQFDAIRLRPPVSAYGEINDYFSSLSRQCGLSASNPWQFETQLGERITNSKKTLFIIISGFEGGLEIGRKEFASILRNISESNKNVRVVLTGGERLAELKYKDGDNSLLNRAKVIEWPELSAQDVINIQNRRYKTACIDEACATRLLTICGGHPGILDICLKLWHKNPTLTDNDYYHAIMNELEIWQWFTPFRSDTGAVRRLCAYLKTPDIGPYMDAYINDPLIRKLYWQNLITKRKAGSDTRLFWRCELIKEVAKKALHCDCE